MRAQTLAGRLEPGVNVDRLDVEAGLVRLQALGWDPVEDARTHMVVGYALQRWARGEEEAAERLAIGLHQEDAELRAAAIDLTSWRVVLASSMAAAQAAAQAAAEGQMEAPAT